MAVSIFSGLKKSGPFGGLIGIIPVDIKYEEHHKARAIATQFAVEDGSIVSDHVILLPKEVEISFAISNQDFDGLSYGIRAATINYLMQVTIENRELHTILTRHYLYTNMVLVDVDVKNKAPFTGTLKGYLKFKQILTPKLTTVKDDQSEVNPSDSFINAKVKSLINGGDQIATSVSDAVRGAIDQVSGVI